MGKKAINIVWFKRDLRLTDHEPLYHAQQSGLPILLVYFFEPSVMTHDDSDVRHWRFVYESILDLQAKLDSFSAKIYYFHNEVKEVFEELTKSYEVNSVFSHQEIGNKITFDRDIEIQQYFTENAIEWKEFQLHGVIRKLKSRKDWDKRWENVMRHTLKIIYLNSLKPENVLIDNKGYIRIADFGLAKREINGND